jgi:SecD/SecF fusion protein
MRERVRGLGVGSATIARSGDEIEVRLPTGGAAARAEHEVGNTAQVLLYDWEPNVVGVGGNPAPQEPTVTGGANAGAVQFGLLEYRAILRALKRPAILRGNDTTWNIGCTQRQAAGCLYGSWYLLDSNHEAVLRGPADTREELYAGYAPPAGARPRAVRVNPGTVLIRARPVEDAHGDIIRAYPNSWFVLNDNPVLTGADITDPRQSYDEGTGGAGIPSVVFGFTSRGKRIFEELTRKVSERGREAQLPGVGKEGAEQHFAFVLDNQLLSAPSIDFAKYPEGIDASEGGQVAGGFTVASARELVSELESGALPIRLELVSRTQM